MGEYWDKRFVSLLLSMESINVGKYIMTFDLLPNFLFFFKAQSVLVQFVTEVVEVLNSLNWYLCTGMAFRQLGDWYLIQTKANFNELFVFHELYESFAYLANDNKYS